MGHVSFEFWNYKTTLYTKHIFLQIILQMKCCRPLPSFYICSQKFIELTSPKLKEVDDLASKSRITNFVKRVGHYLGNEAFYNSFRRYQLFNIQYIQSYLIDLLTHQLSSYLAIFSKKWRKMLLMKKVYLESFYGDRLVRTAKYVTQ